MKFLTEDEIVDDVVNNLTADDIGTLKHYNKDDLIEFHHGTGTHIRNHYLLWHEDNPYTKEGNAYVDEEGIASHPNHADQMSMRIIERVWERVNEQN